MPTMLAPRQSWDTARLAREAASAPKRSVMVAVDLSDQSLKAMQWAVHEFVRPGDCVHLVHVSRCLQPHITIQHSYPGATFDIPSTDPLDDQQRMHDVKEALKAKFEAVLDARHIPHVLHLYADTDNAPASAVADTIFKVADEVRPALLVLAAHDKAYGFTDLLMGSVANYVSQNCTWPLMMVRDYTPHMPPLVIPVASAHPSPHASPSAIRSPQGAELGSPQGSHGGALRRNLSLGAPTLSGGSGRQTLVISVRGKAHADGSGVATPTNTQRANSVHAPYVG